MPRPTTRQELITAAAAQYDKLQSMIDSMPEAMQRAAFAFEDRDKNLRDVLAHLHEWHRMVQRWHQIGCVEGGLPDVPGTGYTWKTLPALNQVIWERYQGVPLAESKALLAESHREVMALIEEHGSDELFSRGVYRWTKSTTLGAYFVSCTSSHYDWAMNKLKKHIRSHR